MFPTLFFDDVFVPSRQKSSFRRPFLENIGYTHIEKDGDVYLVINVLGIDEKDLKVSFEPTDNINTLSLVIDGKTHNETLDYDFSFKKVFTVSKPVKRYGSRVENGLLTIKLEFEQPVTPQIESYKL